MSEATRTRAHAPEVRQRAVEILQEGSVTAPSRQSLAFPRPRLVRWPARMPWRCRRRAQCGTRHHTYSYEVKLAVVKDRLENGLTVREAMIKHKIPSESSVKAWCRQYRESGESALVDKPRGRKPRVKKAE